MLRPLIRFLCRHLASIIIERFKVDVNVQWRSCVVQSLQASTGSLRGRIKTMVNTARLGLYSKDSRSLSIDSRCMPTSYVLKATAGSSAGCREVGK